MRFIITLLLCFVQLSCCRQGTVTRGIGVYPGREIEYTGPALVRDGGSYRNIALERIARHSSSYDYDHTAQLVTDGLIAECPGVWTEAFVNGEALPKRERANLNDLNVSDITGPGPDIEFRLDFHGYAVEADKVIICGHARGDAEAALEVSADGKEWTGLGKCKARKVVDDNGETDLIWHNAEWVISMPATVSFTSLRLSVHAPSDEIITLREIFFYHGGKLLDTLPGAHFSSSWRSLGARDEWISVDLGHLSSFDRMLFHWLNAPQSGRIQVSRDGKKWKDIVKIDSAGGFGDVRFRRVRGRYVRALLDATADGSPFELSEWEIFGRGGTSTVPCAASPRKGNRQYLAGGRWKLRRLPDVDADGNELSLPGYDDSRWMDATVPGTVLASYVNAGAVPDPNHADNQLFISDSYFRSDFWYRDMFEAHPDTPRQFLHFCGVNRRADVFLNGRFMGTVDGAFREKAFDVTGILCEGDNCLAVRIYRNEYYGTVKEQDAWTPCLNGGLAGGENPTMHATVGWDWIPTVRGRDTGIYDDVYIDYTGDVRVEDPFVRTELPLPDTTSALLFAGATLVNHSSRSVSGVLKGSFGDLAFEKEEVLAPGERKQVSWDPMTLENPRLWWPRGYGEPNLYDVRFSFVSSGAVSDSCSFKSGVRQMDYRIYPYVPVVRPRFKSARDGNVRLDIFVNGRRFIGFGGNWGFPEHLLNYRAREYDIAVGYHADMNFTLIRNWVGMTGSRAFYDACDRHGVMIWQDFWLANPSDGPDPRNIGLFEEVAEEYVRRIRNHPSVALYVGRNEGYPPEELDSFLDSMVTREHPGLKYISHSGTDGVSGGGPYHALPVKDYFTLFGTDQLHSERGMPNVMNYENLLRTMGEDAVEPVNTMEHPNAMYGLHDYCLGGVKNSAQRTDSFNRLLCDAFGEPADAREFASLAQWINYDGYRAIFEGRSEYRRGLQLWMSHPAWPSMVWQTYDYYLEPTAAYFGCKKACEPLHIQYNPVHAGIEVVNYRAGDRAGLTASAKVLDMYGKCVWESSCTLDIHEDETCRCFPLEVPEDITEVYFVKLSLSDAEGKLVSDNFYWQGREEGDLKALKSLPEARVSIRVSRSRRTGGSVLTATLANKGNVPAQMLRLKVLDSRTGDLVLPVWYSDNYFFLMPGENRTVSARVRDEDCHGRPVLRLEGFNLPASSR